MTGRLSEVLVKGGIVPALFVLLSFVFAAHAQDLPDKIRGYKVYRGKVAVNADTANPDAAIHVGDPELADISLSGITLEFPAEFTAPYQSGKVELVTFHDLKVNGISVEFEDYSRRFEFKKGEKVTIPKSVRIFVPASGVVKAAWREMTNTRREWAVTGRAFVFGRFRRFGIDHKRVVPIDINLAVRNPFTQN